MRASFAPYSYGLAARARRIYNDVACSGGQGDRPSRRTRPLEATRPGLLGTPGLVYSSSLAAEPLPPLDPLHRHHRNRKSAARHAVIGPACRRSKRSEKLPDDRPRHDHKHDMDDLADDPADRAFGFARLKALPASGRPGFNAGGGPSVQAPWFTGSKFTLSLPLLRRRDFGVLRGNPMWNGWKKAAVGLSALLAFVLLELMAVIGGVAVFLGLVMDVDLPFFAASEE
jgi:hypothetical protein